LLILEEIDAVAPARGPMSQDYKVEELTTDPTRHKPPR
jgi:cell division protease FtsH